MKLKLFYCLVILLSLPLLSWSQSYPYQRIEDGDTVVVMKRNQAEEVNLVFRSNQFTIDSLRFKNLLLTNHVLKYDSVLKESIRMNTTLDSILSSEYIQAMRNQSQADRSINKINKIMPIAWFSFFILFIIF